jgi:FkbM family methyltransferase
MRVETFNSYLVWVPLSIVLVVTVLAFLPPTREIKNASQGLLITSLVCLGLYQFTYCGFVEQAGVTGHMTRNELGIYVVPNKMDTIYNVLRRGTPWEKGLVEEMKRYVKPGDVVVDIGAHIGTHSVPLSKMVGASGRVYAAEPMFVANLNTNIALNQDASSAPVTVWPFALSSHEGFSTIHVVNGNYGASRVVAGDDGVRVETRTLDGLLASEHGRVSLIKIDVEGHEKEVLEGARHVITRDKPVIFIEILPGTPTGEGTRELLYGYGYVVRRLKSYDYIAFPRARLVPRECATVCR